MSKEKQIEILEKQLAFWRHHCTELAKALENEEKISNHYALMLDKTEEELMAERVKTEWISVDERLPEREEIVLCCLGLVQNVYTYKGDNIWEDSYGYYQKDEPITHWMPLPEAPKMKGGKEK